MVEELPSSQRVVAGSVNLKACPWPATATNESVDPASIAQKTIQSVNEALTSKDYQSLAELFVEDGFWRDHLAVSWHLRTLKGRDKIRTFFEKQCNLTKLEVDSSSEFRKPQFANFAPAGNVKGVSFYSKTTTKYGTGRGVVRMVGRGAGYKIWTFFTALEELDAHKKPLGPRRVTGVDHGGLPGRKNWLDKRREATDFADSEPDVLVVGMPLFSFSPSRIIANEFQH